MQSIGSMSTMRSPRCASCQTPRQSNTDRIMEGCQDDAQERADDLAKALDDSKVARS